MLNKNSKISLKISCNSIKIVSKENSYYLVSFDNIYKLII